MELKTGRASHPFPKIGLSNFIRKPSSSASRPCSRGASSPWPQATGVKTPGPGFPDDVEASAALAKSHGSRYFHGLVTDLFHRRSARPLLRCPRYGPAPQPRRLAPTSLASSPAAEAAAAPRAHCAKANGDSSTSLGWHSRMAFWFHVVSKLLETAPVHFAVMKLQSSLSFSIHAKQ